MPPIDKLLSQYSEPVRSWLGEEWQDEEARANYAAANPRPPQQLRPDERYRGAVLPFRETTDGRHEWAIPGLLQDVFDSARAVRDASGLGLGPATRPSQMPRDEFEQMLSHGMTGATAGITGGITRAMTGRASPGEFELGSSGARQRAPWADDVPPVANWAPIGVPLKNLVKSKWISSTPSSDLGVIPRYAQVERSKLTVSPDGTVYYDVPAIDPSRWPGGRGPDPFMYDPGPRMFRYVDDFTWPFEDDVFIRSSIRKGDRDYLAKGAHRGSINHATGEPEGGLSVARGVEAADGYKHAYFVRGKQIGQGSDSEPLLDLSSARPIGPVRRSDEMVDILVDAIQKKRRMLGLSDDEWRALHNARFIKP